MTRLPARPRSLLIDDSPDICTVPRVALESEGYVVLEASDGREAVRLYRAETPRILGPQATGEAAR